ncbi:MAG: hypothetical protein NTW32_01855 [Chloroflexi bacterium]|nr:hypothetical protein [Chloroflexota bacterium]
MFNPSTHQPRFPFFRRLFRKKYAGLWKPAVVTGAGGTALVIWFEEIIAFSTEILALIFLPILAGAIYLLDILIFKSRMPRREDLETPTDQGAKK